MWHHLSLFITIREYCVEDLNPLKFSIRSTQPFDNSHSKFYISKNIPHYCEPEQFGTVIVSIQGWQNYQDRNAGLVCKMSTLNVRMQTDHFKQFQEDLQKIKSSVYCLSLREVDCQCCYCKRRGSVWASR